MHSRDITDISILDKNLNGGFLRCTLSITFHALHDEKLYRGLTVHISFDDLDQFTRSHKSLEHTKDVCVHDLNVLTKHLFL